MALKNFISMGARALNATKGLGLILKFLQGTVFQF